MGVNLGLSPYGKNYTFKLYENRMLMRMFEPKRQLVT
jgi:hypothetical protein